MFPAHSQITPFDYEQGVLNEDQGGQNGTYDDSTAHVLMGNSYVRNTGAVLTMGITAPAYHIIVALSQEL